MTEDEAGLEGAVANDADAEYVRNVCENDIVGPHTPLAKYIPVLRWLLSNPGKSTALLQAASAISFTRYINTIHINSS